MTQIININELKELYRNSAFIRKDALYRYLKNNLEQNVKYGGSSFKVRAGDNFSDYTINVNDFKTIKEMFHEKTGFKVIHTNDVLVLSGWAE